MIGWLRGIVRTKDPVASQVVVDVSGVGYQLMVSVQTMAMTPAVGETTEFAVHTHVREDALELFGFARPEERVMFRLLLSVPQVGPRLAVSVLGGLSLEDLLSAIADSDRAMLQRIPGVGKKTAERILLDLQDKVDALRGSVGGSTAPASDAAPTADGGIAGDARAVLVNLGWKQKQVDAVLEGLDLEAEASLDDVVRAALATLMGGVSRRRS